jgi:DNA-binding transcriptional regulator YdaS (Cro superfamily)
MPNYDPALVRVLEKAGGPTRVAEHLGVVVSAVTQWTRVPARHVPRLEALTGIPGREIRPDLWDAPDPSPANDAPNPKSKRARSADAANSPTSSSEAA